MASRYSLTIQLAEPSMADGSPGHAAAIVNTPSGQTYAGLGPANHGWSSLKGAWSPRWTSNSCSQVASRLAERLRLCRGRV